VHPGAQQVVPPLTEHGVGLEEDRPGVDPVAGAPTGGVAVQEQQELLKKNGVFL